MHEQRTMSLVHVLIAAIFGCTILPSFVCTIEFAVDKHEEVQSVFNHFFKENRRTPQNVMRTDPQSLVSGRTLVYAASSMPEDHLLSKVLSKIKNNTCIKINHTTLMHAKSHPKEKICVLENMDSRTDLDSVADYSFKTLLMCLGKLYEHSRSDRDDYIEINWFNIEYVNFPQFKIVPYSTTQGLPYDFQSCMQFAYDEYSNNGQPTCCPINESIPIEVLGAQKWPSKQDYLDINLSYCGTEVTIASIAACKIETDFITLNWSLQRKHPEKLHIELNYQCTLFCERRPYKTAHAVFPVKLTTFNITTLLPASLCTVNFLTVYNRARVDPGIDVQFETLLSEPSKPPSSVKVLNIRESEVVLVWKPIPCPHQNGRILHYLINYMHILSSRLKMKQELETEDSSLRMTIMNLRPNTNYTVSVAGVNLAGIGVFSSPIAFRTRGAGPCKVFIKSSKSTCDSITIYWHAPHDEHNPPTSVRVKYSYKLGNKVHKHQKTLSFSRKGWTVKDLMHEVPVSFSLRGLDVRGKEGPETSFVIQTQKCRLFRKCNCTVKRLAITREQWQSSPRLEITAPHLFLGRPLRLRRDLPFMPRVLGIPRESEASDLMMLEQNESLLRRHQEQLLGEEAEVSVDDVSTSTSPPKESVGEQWQSSPHLQISSPHLFSGRPFRVSHDPPFVPPVFEMSRESEASDPMLERHGSLLRSHQEWLLRGDGNEGNVDYSS